MEDINSIILHRLAFNTKQKEETITETIGLLRQDLLFSEDYSKVIFPIYNDSNMNSVIENIIFFAYLKAKYNSKIYVITNFNKNNYIGVYQIFNNYYDKLFNIKTYVNLTIKIKELKITKIIYNKSLDLFTDLNLYLTNGIVVNHKLIMKNISFNDISINYLISASNINDIPKLTNYEILTPSKSFINDLVKIINCDNYVNSYNNSIYDFIAPFLDCNVFYFKTNFYNQEIFTYSISSMKNKIMPIKS